MVRESKRPAKTHESDMEEEATWKNELGKEFLATENYNSAILMWKDALAQVESIPKTSSTQTLRLKLQLNLALGHLKSGQAGSDLTYMIHLSCGAQRANSVL